MPSINSSRTGAHQAEVQVLHRTIKCSINCDLWSTIPIHWHVWNHENSVAEGKKKKVSFCSKLLVLCSPAFTLYPTLSYCMFEYSVFLFCFFLQCRLRDISGLVEKQHHLLKLIMQKMEITSESEDTDGPDSFHSHLRNLGSKTDKWTPVIRAVMAKRL